MPMKCCSDYFQSEASYIVEWWLYDAAIVIFDV